MLGKGSGTPSAIADTVDTIVMSLPSVAAVEALVALEQVTEPQGD